MDIPPLEHKVSDRISGGPELEIARGRVVVDYAKFSPSRAALTRKFHLCLWEQSGEEADDTATILEKVHSIWVQRRVEPAASSGNSSGGDDLLQYAETLGFRALVGVAGFTVQVEDDDVETDNARASVFASFLTQAGQRASSSKQHDKARSSKTSPPTNEEGERGSDPDSEGNSDDGDVLTALPSVEVRKSVAAQTSIHWSPPCERTFVLNSAQMFAALL